MVRFQWWIKGNRTIRLCILCILCNWVALAPFLLVKVTAIFRPIIIDIIKMNITIVMIIISSHVTVVGRAVVLLVIQALVSSVGVLLRGCAVLYYMPDVQLFLRPPWSTLFSTSALISHRTGVYHVIIHVFFCRSFVIIRSNPALIVSCGALPSIFAVLYYMPDVQLFLRPPWWTFFSTSARTSHKSDVCHVILHGFFYRSFFILRLNPAFIVSCGALPSSCAALYYMLDAQLFLQPQPVPYSDHSPQLWKSISSPRLRTSQRIGNY
jgi:hypothetical protein